MKGRTTIHWIRETDHLSHPKVAITHCGKKGSFEGSDEWTTYDGYESRFEATESLRQVNCKRCLKSYERISNGPWGCVRSSRIPHPHS
jgi:hypothetical protein